MELTSAALPRMKDSKKTKYNIIDILTCALVVLNLYGMYLEDLLGINSFVFTVVPLGLLCMFSLSREMTVNTSIAVPVLCCMAVCITQFLAADFNQNMLKNLLYLVLFYFMTKSATESTWLLLKKTLVVVSIVMTVDAVMQIPTLRSMNLNLYNVRNFTMLDKPAYSLIITFAVVIMLTDILYRKTEHWLIVTGIIAVELVINIVVVQSKASLVCLALAAVVMMIKTPRKVRSKIITIGVIGIIAILAVCIVRPDLIPDYVKVMANQYLGLFSNTTINNYEKYAGTYDQRSEIYNYAFNLFAEHFLIGVGFGNYSKYGETNTGIIETESSLINTFVEGGIFYGIAHLVLVVVLLMKLFMMNQRQKWRIDGTQLFMIFLLYFAFNFQNDYMTLMYWAFTGVAFAYVFKSSNDEEQVEVA